jgi:C-terminal processing protease CtpA/Prc
MTSRTYPDQFTLFRVISLLGISLACLMLLGAETFAVSPHTSPNGPTIGPKKSGDPHLSLQSGIVGLALHLTARRVGDPAQLIIRAVHPSGPAARAGVTHGEEIYSVNGGSLIGKTYQEVIRIIRGEIGSRVQLGLRGAQGERTVTLLRVNESILMEQTPQTM